MATILYNSVLCFQLAFQFRVSKVLFSFFYYDSLYALHIFHTVGYYNFTALCVVRYILVCWIIYEVFHFIHKLFS